MVLPVNHLEEGSPRVPAASGPAGQTRRSFIEEARRAQIVGCAIDTIAELGYAQASLARIARRAGISKGVIGYHFAGKDEVLAEVVTEVLSRAEAYMRQRIGGHPTGRETLRAYIESNLGFMSEYRSHVIAIAEIARNARRADGSSSFDPAILDAATAGLAQLLADYQKTGEFRADFDPNVMAGAIRAAIDAVPRALARDPSLDVEHHARELAALFDLATRNPQLRSRTRGR
jgi:TetR/AcrR family transcriptional regulator, fatty acid metabolism regulator protein